MLGSTLSRFAPMWREPDPAAAKRAARNAYEASGGRIVLINVDWLTSWVDRKQLDLLAEKALGVKGKL